MYTSSVSCICGRHGFMGTFVFWKHPSLYPRCGDAQRESCVVTLRVPRAFQEMGSNVGLASTWSSRLSLRTIHRFAFWSFDEGQEVSCLRIGFGGYWPRC